MASFKSLGLMGVEKILTVGGFRKIDDCSFFKTSSKFFEFRFLLLNQHYPNRLSLPADDWRQQTERASSAARSFPPKTAEEALQSIVRSSKSGNQKACLLECTSTVNHYNV